MFEFKLNDEIRLRLLETRHAEELFDLVDANRDHLRSWLPWVDRTQELADVHDFIVGTQYQYAENRGFVTGIWYGTGLVGVVGHNEVNWENRFCRLGYWLAAPFEGKGIMTMACRAITTYSFQDMELNRVDIRAAVANSKSRAIPERLGFKLEGILRDAEWLYDRFVDHAVYGMLAREWASEQS